MYFRVECRACGARFKAELDRTQAALKKSEQDNAELREKANASAKMVVDLANERVRGSV